MDQVGEQSSKRSTSLGGLDTRVGHQAQSHGHILHREAQSTSNRGYILERLTQHGHVGVCTVGCSSKYVSKVCGVFCLQTETSQRIGYDIRYRCKVFTRRSSKVHHTTDAIHHLLSIPTSHCHVVEGFGCFRCRELCGGTHFLCLVRQGFEFFACSVQSRHSSDLSHSLLEVTSGLNGGSAQTNQGSCHGSSQSHADTRQRTAQSTSLVDTSSGLVEESVESRLGSTDALVPTSKVEKQVTYGRANVNHGSSPPLELAIQLCKAAILFVENWLLLVIDSAHYIRTCLIEAICCIRIVDTK